MTPMLKTGPLACCCWLKQQALHLCSMIGGKLLIKMHAVRSYDVCCVILSCRQQGTQASLKPEHCHGHRKSHPTPNGGEAHHAGLQVAKALLAWLENIADDLQPPAAGQERTPELLGLRPLPVFDTLEQACKVQPSGTLDVHTGILVRMGGQ